MEKYAVILKLMNFTRGLFVQKMNLNLYIVINGMITKGHCVTILEILHIWENMSILGKNFSIHIPR